MRVPSDGFLLESLREIREKTAALYQQVQDQDREQVLSLDREITRRLRQIDGMILSLEPQHRAPNSIYSRDFFRILNTLRANLAKIQNKIKGDEPQAPEALPDVAAEKPRQGIASLYY